jgi:CDP-diacylglycerol pyrophosphatase
MRKLLALVLFLFAFGASASDPDVLWKLVDGKCVPEAMKGEAPRPCESVDLVHGEAVLKDLVGIAQYLVIPTARVTGIEDPQVLQPNDDFATAWHVRKRVEAKLGQDLPRNAVSLVINSRNGRSQNQLHIHVDCLAEKVRGILVNAAPDESWAPFPTPLAGHFYIARFLPGETLDGVNPFRLLADHVKGPIGDWTLAVVGAKDAAGKPGFILLAQHDAEASAEQLQDHNCEGYY